MRPTIRCVWLTERKPVSVLSETAHNTEWTMTKTRLVTPIPNQSSASGRMAIAGSGLNIAVRVARISVPTRVLMARVVIRAEIPMATA
ncbi:hypothetical protein D3C80_2045490 [compost metagenome]